MTSSLALHFYLLELKKLFSYRVEFWIGFAGTILSQFGVAYFLWQAVFAARGTASVGGYSFGALMLYYLMVPLVERVVNGQESGFMSGEIYDGGLTRYLLYPTSYFRIKYVAKLAQTTVFLSQLILILALFLAVFRTPYSLSPRSVAMAVPVFLLSGLLAFVLTACIDMVAFWADNVWNLLILNRMVSSLLGGGLLPLSLYPEAMRDVLDWLPWSRLVSFPIRCLLGEVGTADWLRGLGLTALWFAAFAALAAWLWRKGVKGYAGVGI